MSAIKQMIGMIAGRIVMNKLTAALSGASGRLGREPGRYPHPEYGPIVVPKSPELKPGESSYDPGHLMPWAVYAGFGALIWYAWRESDAPLGAEPIRSPLFEERTRDLIPGLRRELRTLKQEDIATSEDAVEACLERRYGWKLKRLRELRDSIAEKGTPDLFAEEEDLTKAEAELLENIEDCLERIESEYGSLEAAGLPMISCGSCDDTEEETEADSPQ